MATNDVTRPDGIGKIEDYLEMEAAPDPRFCPDYTPRKRLPLDYCPKGVLALLFEAREVLDDMVYFADEFSREQMKDRNKAEDMHRRALLKLMAPTREYLRIATEHIGEFAGYPEEEEDDAPLSYGAYAAALNVETLLKSDDDIFFTGVHASLVDIRRRVRIVYGRTLADLQESQQPKQGKAPALKPPLDRRIYWRPENGYSYPTDVVSAIKKSERFLHQWSLEITGPDDSLGFPVVSKKLDGKDHRGDFGFAFTTPDDPAAQWVKWNHYPTHCEPRPEDPNDPRKMDDGQDFCLYMYDQGAALHFIADSLKRLYFAFDNQKEPAHLGGLSSILSWFSEALGGMLRQIDSIDRYAMDRSVEIEFDEKICVPIEHLRTAVNSYAVLLKSQSDTNNKDEICARSIADTLEGYARRFENVIEKYVESECKIDEKYKRPYDGVVDQPAPLTDVYPLPVEAGRDKPRPDTAPILQAVKPEIDRESASESVENGLDHVEGVQDAMMFRRVGAMISRQWNGVCWWKPWTWAHQPAH